ncbi:VTT domain-containing protein [Halomonas sp. Bachu 37]|uniref:TVP38/TMEM64 family protein n=1 Tax=Halomonas kashgarensis TaxID=3084920 RepID=UPI0032172448
MKREQGCRWVWLTLGALLAMAVYAWVWHTPELIMFKQWAMEASHHPLVVMGVMLIIALTLAIGLPGSIGLWLIAPFYTPWLATSMLTLSSVAGAWGAYLLAARLGKSLRPSKFTLKIMHILEQRSDLLTQCALRVLPGFPHSVVNYAAGLCRLPLERFLLAAAVGLAIKWTVYSNAIYGTLQSLEGEDALTFEIVLPLLALTLLLLFGAWMRRRLVSDKRD